KACPLGDAARDDGRNGGGERAQEEELDEREALWVEARSARVAAQALRCNEERDPVGNCVADEKVRDGRDGEVDQDLAQRVDLVLVPHGASFEKREAAVHGKDKNGPREKKQHVRAALQPLDGRLNVRHPQPPISYAHSLGRPLHTRSACVIGKSGAISVKVEK